MDCSTVGFLVHHQFLELAETHVHQVGDAIQPCHPLSSPSAFNLSQHQGLFPDAGKDWRQEEKGMIENEIVGWYHQLDGYEFEQAPGDGEEQGSLACCSPWGRKEPNTTEWLNNNNRYFLHPRHHSWRRQWHPTPVLLPGKSHGWRSLVGCSPWGR